MWIGTTRGLALWDGEMVAGSVPDLGTLSPFQTTTSAASHHRRHAVRFHTERDLPGPASQGLKPWTDITAVFPLTSINVRGIATDGRTLLALISGLNSGGGGIQSGFRWVPGTSSWVVENPAASGGGQAVRRLRDDHGVILATSLAGTHMRDPSGVWTQLPNSPATDNLDNTALEVSAIIVPSLTASAPPDTFVFGPTGGRLLERALPQWTSRTPPDRWATTAAPWPGRTARSTPATTARA